MADNNLYLDLRGIQYIWDKISNSFVLKDGNKTLSDNNFTDEEKEKLASLDSYELTIASPTRVGGIKVGDGLYVDANNRLNTYGVPTDNNYTTTEKNKLATLTNYELKPATPSSLGGVKIGNNLYIDAADRLNTYGVSTDNNYTTAEKNKLANLVNYSLPAATSLTLGGVKVGSNLQVQEDGTLNANITWTNIQNKPSTINGYGITDAAAKSTVTTLETLSLLEKENIPGTTQSITYTSSGDVNQIIHSQNNLTVRTDTFTFGEDTITELRRLSTGETLTIVINTETLVTTTTYAA